MQEEPAKENRDDELGWFELYLKILHEQATNNEAQRCQKNNQNEIEQQMIIVADMMDSEEQKHEKKNTRKNPKHFEWKWFHIVICYHH